GPQTGKGELRDERALLCRPGPGTPGAVRPDGVGRGGAPLVPPGDDDVHGASSATSVYGVGVSPLTPWRAGGPARSELGSAGGVDDLSRHPAGVVGGEEGDHVGHVLGTPDPAERRQVRRGLLGGLV